MRLVVLWVSFGIRLMHITRTPLSTDDPFILENVKLHARVSFDDDDAYLFRDGSGHGNHADAWAEQVKGPFGAWCCRIPLPIGPIWTEGLTDHPITVELIDEAGNVTPHPAGWWIEGGRYPVLSLTASGRGQHLRITYPAGYGMDQASIPADLQLAINDHAAHMFDARALTDHKQGLSIAAARIAARHRKVAVA